MSPSLPFLFPCSKASIPSTQATTTMLYIKPAPTILFKSSICHNSLKIPHSNHATILRAPTHLRLRPQHSQHYLTCKSTRCLYAVATRYHPTSLNTRAWTSIPLFDPTRHLDPSFSVHDKRNPSPPRPTCLITRSCPLVLRIMSTYA